MISRNQFIRNTNTPGPNCVSPATVEALGSGYGLATQIWKTDLGTSYGHGGWFPGYLSQMEYFTNERIAVAIQFNTDAVGQLKKGPRRYLLDIARAVISESAVKKAA